MGSTTKTKLIQAFPTYLDRRSKGAAVELLHAILCSQGFGQGIIRDGKYGKATVTAVKKMQERMEIDQDGNFGPETRQHLADYWNIDVSLIPHRKGDTTTWFGPETKGPQTWDDTTAKAAA